MADDLRREAVAVVRVGWRRHPSVSFIPPLSPTPVTVTMPLDRMEKQNQQLRDVTTDVLALAGELRKGTIERVLGMSDLELGLRTLLRTQSPERR